MATIEDTLKEIEHIQEEFKLSAKSDGFIKELMSFTTVIYFDYLSHAVLDRAKDVDLSMTIGSSKYYKLYAENGLLLQYIRFTNIGQFSVAWNVYEKYLREKYKKEYGLSKLKIKDLFNDLIKKVVPSNEAQIIEEFEIMRNTRNSFHDVGIYNSKYPYFEGILCGEKFEFTPGHAVTPLRIINVIKTMWSHYKEFEK